MSQTFDVYPAEHGMIQFSSLKGSERFCLSKMGYHGPNRLVVPSFINKDQEPLNSCNAKFNEASSLATQVGRESRGYNPTTISGNMKAVKSQVGGYLELDTYHSRTKETALLVPDNMVRTNKATYYLRLESQCPKLDEIEVILGDQTRINFHGNIEMYSYDKEILQLVVTLPPGSRLRLSYSQIIPFKDSILQKLSRIQYGQNPIQPKVV